MLAATAVVACGLGVVGTAGYYGAVDRSVPAEDGAATTEVTTSGTTVTGSGGGGDGVLYEVWALEEAADQADIDRWFRSAQTEQDALPAEMVHLDPSSSRYVGQIGADGGAWIAKSVDGDYCVTVDLGASGGAASGCADPTVFADSGAWVSTGDSTMFWNPESVILSAQH